jgi:polyisoprenoid-binding protein YceI
VKTLLLGTAGALALAASGLAQDVTAPSGAYTLDKTHAFIIWSLKHIGTSTYYGQFNDFDAQLTFDPENPAASTLSVTVPVTSLYVNYNDASEPDLFYNELLGRPTSRNAEGDDRFFREDEFPTITFNATGIDLTGDGTGTVTGDLTLLGVTKPLTLDVTFNGVRPGFGTPTVIGFSATGTVNRSEWGMAAEVPAEILSEGVDLMIEAEFFAPE